MMPDAVPPFDETLVKVMFSGVVPLDLLMLTAVAFVGDRAPVCVSAFSRVRSIPIDSETATGVLNHDAGRGAAIRRDTGQGDVQRRRTARLADVDRGRSSGVNH